MRVVLASRNDHKVAEMSRLLNEAGLGVELLGAGEFASIPDIPETGATFAANALLKARAVSAATGHAAIADDSGICVDALNGMPGVLSARWSGRHGDDRANLDLLLGQLRDVPPARRSAHFACAVAIVLPGEGETVERVVEGLVEGRIIDEPRGAHGFGYDPIFLPVGSEVTMAELSAAEKDAISHRGQALRTLIPVLRDLIAQA